MGTGQTSTLILVGGLVGELVRVGEVLGASLGARSPRTNVGELEGAKDGLLLGEVDGL